MSNFQHLSNYLRAMIHVRGQTCGVASDFVRNYPSERVFNDTFANYEAFLDDLDMQLNTNCDSCGGGDKIEGKDICESCYADDHPNKKRSDSDSEEEDEDTECDCGGGGRKLRAYDDRCYSCEWDKLKEERDQGLWTRKEHQDLVKILDDYANVVVNMQICEECGTAKPDKFDGPGAYCRDCLHALKYESAEEEPEAPPPKKSRSPVHAEQVVVPVREVIDLTKPNRVQITVDLTGDQPLTIISC